MSDEKAPETNSEPAKHTAESAAANSEAPATSTEAEQPAAAAPPPPEPLTPERAAAENRRNDLFILVAALVVAFLLGLFKITDSDLWIHLKAGWQIDQEGVPTRDSFSFSTGERSWVNSNWLFDWALYQAELVETRWRVRQLVADYERLLENRQQPQPDEEGLEVTKPLPDEQRQQLKKAFAQLASTADTSDTFQMRFAAEQTAEIVRDAELQVPQPSQESEKGSYPALARYAAPGGETLIALAAPIVVKGIVLAAMAGVLLLVRHPGPTRWWTAAIAVLVLVAMGDHLTFTPEILSFLFLAVAFWILHEFQSGRTWSVWLLVPLEMLWANVDSLFPLGLVLAAIVLLGHYVGRASGRSDAQQPSGKDSALAASSVLAIVATLANPFGLSVWSVPIDRIVQVFGRITYVTANLAQLCGSDAEWVAKARDEGNELLTLAPDMSTPLSRGFVYSLQDWPIPIPSVATLSLIVLALGSFILNRQRFRGTRLLTLLLFVGMFMLATRYEALVAMAAGVVLCLNGQEWYLSRFGTETRITRGWRIWSLGGRAVTILVIMGVAMAGRTSRLGAAGGGEFGFGIQWVKFDLGAAKFLRYAKLKGRGLNTVPLQGNLLVWANYPPGKVFLDGREDLHLENLAEFESLKRALRGNDDVTWRPLLDRYQISHVILNIAAFTDRITFLRTYKALQNDTKQWKLVYRDSSNAVFGRVGLPEGHELAEDSAWFERNGLDPARLVFKENARRLPEPPAPVTPPSIIDWFLQTRRIPSGETIAASHFLNEDLDASDSPGAGPVIRPENCYLAIRHARIGLAEQQRVAPLGYLILSRAYLRLFSLELSQAQNPEAVELRQLQLLASLNQLVAANPNNLEAQLHLAFTYLNLQFLDLADEHFEAAIKLMPEGAKLDNFLTFGGRTSPFDKSDLIGISEKIKLNVERVQEDLKQVNPQILPTVKADYLVRRGCPGLAIGQLTEASAFAGTGLDVSATLSRLYIQIGQAGDNDRGAERELINMQGSGGMRPGVKKQLWAMVKLMQGDYEHARTFFEDAIAETRHSLAQDAILGLTNDIRFGALLNLDRLANAIEDANRQAGLEFQLGMLQLEAGEPAEAARHFKQALAVREAIPYRPAIAFYLEKITGEKLEPLPEPPKDEEPGSPSSSEASDKSGPASTAVLPPKPAQKTKE